MTSILFLDDDPTRHKVFRQMMADHEVTIDFVWSADEAFEAISRKKYDLACLDHDLSVDDHYCDPYGETKEKNGTYLACKMRDELQKEALPEMTILHSYNKAGREEMYRILVNDVGIRAMVRPFGM